MAKTHYPVEHRRLAKARRACRAHREHRYAETPARSRMHADRKSTRLNSSHSQISYAVFCLKKKKNTYSMTHLAPTLRPLIPQPTSIATSPAYASITLFFQILPESVCDRSLAYHTSPRTTTC